MERLNPSRETKFSGANESRENIFSLQPHPVHAQCTERDDQPITTTRYLIVFNQL